MKISELANLQNETDWVLPPTLIGLIFGIMGAIVAPIQQTNQPNQSGPGLNTGISDPEFNKALPHILKWEGDKCTNHPADNGGKTFKGVTESVARKHGFSDPCKLSDQQIYAIYHKDYWVRVPQNLDFNRKLVYFNLLVNGTKQRCLSKPTALTMLDCQEGYYGGLADAPHFLSGWLNRNNDIKEVVK